uniref:Uncharacterized protein n=1 Tax=Neospora caninum (strain Liverpool) TaxID=572307 RepID=A0A0F7UFA7_NEOCL|nr:TPA: hypothetical protein BN1204_031110 [Neospora caninum Liverpool]
MAVCNSCNVYVNPIPALFLSTSRLFCRSFKGIILPGNAERIQFSFRATRQGVYHGMWRLKLTPPGDTKTPMLVPIWAAVGGVDDGEASVQELEQRLCRRVMAQYINETLLHLVDSLSYSHMPDQRVERANIQAYTFEHVNSFYRVDGSEAIIKEFTKIRDDVRAFKEALPSEETNNGGPPHPAWSHHGPKNAHPGTDESLSLALLFDEIFMLDDIHLEEKRCFALRLQSLITTAQESRARYSRAAASLMESIIATLVPACCSAIADARDQAGQPPMMPQWLPSGFKLADASVSSAADIPDSRASQPSLSSTKPSDDIPTQRHSTQIEVKKPLHWSNKEGQVASRGGRLHTTNIPDWQAPAAEVLARNFSQYLETWDYDAVLSHANDVLLNNFADKLDNTGLDVLTQATPEKNLENMKVAAMKLLGDVCMKVDLEKAAPAIEDVLLELLGLICEEHDAVLRFLSTKEDIWDFIDEKLPEEWDSARGPQIAETSQETVVYFISDWARFMGLALDCIYEKQIDKVEREVVNANSDGDVPALVDERKASQEYNEERHITLLFHVLGVDTIVLDYFPTYDINSSWPITIWQSMVPARRILGPRFRRFQESLCMFMGHQLQDIRQAILARYKETKEKTRRCWGFNSVVDYVVDSIRRQISLQAGLAGESLQSENKRTVTVMTMYCPDFWDIRTFVTLNRVTESIRLLERVVSLSASTTIFLCGDICTALLGFLLDGRVQIRSKAKSRDESLRSEHSDEGVRAYASTTNCLPQAEYWLPPLDTGGLHDASLGPAGVTDDTSCRATATCSDPGETLPAKASKHGKDEKDEERYPTGLSFHVEGAQAACTSFLQAETSYHPPRGLLLMRKFPGWRKDILLRVEHVRRPEETHNQQLRKTSGTRYRPCESDATMVATEKSTQSKHLGRKTGKQGMQTSDDFRRSMDQTSMRVFPDIPHHDASVDDDERIVCCHLPPTAHILSWFLQKWEGPIRYTTPEDIEVADHIEEVAVYWGAGPSLLSDMKEAIRTSHLLCYLGDALERCNMKDSKVGDNDMSGRSASISSTSELLSHVAALLPADLTPSRSVSTRSWSEHEDEDDSDQEEHNTMLGKMISRMRVCIQRLEAIMGCEPSNKIMTIMAK